MKQTRSIVSKQTDVHEDLQKVVARHAKSEFKRPYAQHTINAFEVMLAWLDDWQGEVILDACCGVGESTVKLSNQYSQAKVLGIDKSISRLDKHKSYANPSVSNVKDRKPSNYLLLQADLQDFWRLLVQHIAEKQPLWHISKQFILYPNPYPKKSQLGKRWHGSALFPSIIALSPNIELRSNWLIYLQEFLQASAFYGLSGDIQQVANKHIDTMAITPFERKYLAANQTCFKLAIRPCGSDK